jgi:D-alanine-D-alanine ligase
MALQSLKFVRLLRKIKIGILLTTDDVLQGRISQNLVQNKSRNADYIIGLKGSGLNGTIVTSRSGAAVYNCTMGLKDKGRAEDVSKAVNVLSKIMNNWTAMTDEANGLVVVPTDVQLKSNIMGHYANADINLSIRFNDISSMEKIDHKIKQSVSKKDHGMLLFQIEGGIRRPAMKNTEQVINFYQIIKKIAQNLDIRVLEEHRWSSSDICFADDDKPMVDGMGPLGSKVKGRDEYILRHSLLERSALLALTLHEIGMEKK